MRLLKTLLALMALCLTSYGSQVVSVHPSGTAVAVTHGASQAWLEEDELCVQGVEDQLACGIVTRATETGAILSFEEAVRGVSVGDPVRLASAGSYASQASGAGQGNFANQIETAGTTRSFDFSLGLLWFTENEDAHMAFGEIQKALTHNLTLGVFGSYWNSNQGSVFLSSAGIGTGLHYYSMAPYHGLWLNVSVARQFNSAETQTGGTSWTATNIYATLGWRWASDKVDGGFAFSMGPAFIVNESETDTTFFMRFHVGANFGPSEVLY